MNTRNPWTITAPATVWKRLDQATDTPTGEEISREQLPEFSYLSRIADPVDEWTFFARDRSGTVYVGRETTCSLERREDTPYHQPYSAPFSRPEPVIPSVTVIGYFKR